MSDDAIGIPELTEIEILQKNLNQIILSLSAQFDSKLDKIDKLMESYESQIAIMATGFAEQAVFIEALLGQINFASDEAKRNFHDSIHDARQKMFAIMKAGANGLVANDNPRLASALEDVVDSKLSNATQQ